MVLIFEVVIRQKSGNGSVDDAPNVQLGAIQYLALINRAGGLYGRILTEVVSTDRTQ